ncbi:unnamed protein product [Paramecium pentaurelia]|uniref:Uncharacterized protein n=1 Tax=Paramecium pentaurelia TaxID=43138 RepID=A0A8S1TMU0_9CILI|nr:unnamed protein product [Paramecium pentaurelia]
MFEFYFSFLKKIALCCHFLITFSSKCDLMELEPNEFIMPLQQNVRLIEMDSDNFEQLNQIKFVLTEQAFNISYLESEKIRSTIISNFIFYNSTQQQWICKLLKYQSYNILCNNHIKLNPTNIDVLNMELQFKVDIMTEAQYNCDEFFQWQISNFLLFCSSQNIIKIYSVDISNTTLLITEKEIDQHQFDQCIREYIKQSEEQYFTIFYGCFQWAIFEFSGSSLDLLIDQYIMLNKTNQTIPYVQRIQICKYLNKDLSEYYLITNDGYYQFQVNNKNKQLYWVSFEKFQNIQQLIFISNWCKVNYLIIYQNQTTSIIINVLKKEFVNINSNVIQVHESFNLLFLLSNKSLDVIMNQQIKQHIQLQANHLFFLDNNKYFYYIDELNSQISFYSYDDLNQFLIPKKTYVFKVLLKDQFEISLLNCYKVNIINNIDKAIIFNDIHLLNSCQEDDSIIFDKQCIELPEQYDFQVQQVSISTILNITEIVEFQNNCDFRFISKDSVLIYKEDNYAIFKNNHFITIQECINKINSKIPIQTYSEINYLKQFNNHQIIKYQLKMKLNVLVNFKIMFQSQLKWDKIL